MYNGRNKFETHVSIYAQASMTEKTLINYVYSKLYLLFFFVWVGGGGVPPIPVNLGYLAR